MRTPNILRLVIILGFILVPGAAWAQSGTTGAIAGVVRDTTGAVLPGVTVEAASPALIEKVRTVVTDDQGQYKIVDLRPGTYTVTFTLTGFSTVKRESLELNTGVTLPVNAELRVGSLAETITVSGASPVVDTQNVRGQNVLTREVLDTIPTSKTSASLAALTLGASVGLGASGSGGDVGGSKGEQVSPLTIHGGTSDGLTTVDGMKISSVYDVAPTHHHQFNQMAVQEITIETSGASAESPSGGVNVNMVPKDGGNTIRGTFIGDYTGENLQNSNLTDELRSRGLTRTNRINNIYEVGVGLGGPLIKDKLWFFTAHWARGSQEEYAGIYYNKTQNTLFYTPDLSRPGVFDKYTRDSGLRLTWQASPKHKFTLSGNLQDYCWCNYSLGTNAPEASWVFRIWPNNNFQTTWSYPASNRLLVEAGALWRPNRPLAGRQPETGDARSVRELSTGILYGSNFVTGPPGSNTDYGRYSTDAYGTRFSVSYITGSHAFKAGSQTLAGLSTVKIEPIQTQYTFRNQVPVGLVQIATPHYQEQREKLDLGLYAQDQWTIRRLTLNLGVRFDYINSYVPAQTRPADEWTPAFDVPEIPNLPNWKDISPRLGAAYDLFGNGKTAIKFSLGRYPVLQTTQIARRANPAGAIPGTTSRTWNDLNGNYVPDCDLRSRAATGECGAMANQRFGGRIPATEYAQDYTEGWWVRPYTWQESVTLQHELRPGIGLTVGYFRTSWHNFEVTDNRAVAPSDFDEFCIAAPQDARLPGGGGYQVCGIYDVKLAKFGQVDNLTTLQSGFGKRTQVYNGVDISIAARFGRGGVLSGGMSLGQTVTDNCAPPDAPQQFCRNTVPLRGNTQVKIAAAYPLPWGLQASGTFRNVPGLPISADYAATNAEIAPSLGRNLSACGTAASCTATATVTIIEPNTQFESRPTMADVRLTKNIRLGRLRVQPRVDVYNLLNSASVLGELARYGPSFLQPTEIFQGRFVKFGVQIDF